MPGICAEWDVIGQQMAEMQGFFKLFVFDAVVDQLFQDLRTEEGTAFFFVFRVRWGVGPVFFLAGDFFFEILFARLVLFLIPVTGRILTTKAKLIEIVEDIHIKRG